MQTFCDIRYLYRRIVISRRFYIAPVAKRKHFFISNFLRFPPEKTAPRFRDLATVLARHNCGRSGS
jgi:hypothetical protein